MKDQPGVQLLGPEQLGASRVELPPRAPAGSRASGSRQQEAGGCCPSGLAAPPPAGRAVNWGCAGPALPASRGAAGFFLQKVPGLSLGSLSRPVPGVHRGSSSVPPSAAPPCFSSGCEDALPSVRRGPLQDFHFPVFWVFLLFKIYFIQV